MENVRKRSSESGSALLGGAAVLGAAAIFSKLLGTLQKIPLQNVAGDEAFGIYNAVFPFYTFLLFLSTAGFPVAVSKFVSEHAASGRDEEARRVLAVASVLMFGMGLRLTHSCFWGRRPSPAGWAIRKPRRPSEACRLLSCSCR